MTIAFIPLLVAVAGLILFSLANGKPARVGEILLFAGALASLLQGSHSITLH